MTVIPNGVDHGQFNPAPRTRRAPPSAPRRGIKGHFFLYVARLEHPAKNHAGLIEAFSRFKSSTGSQWRLVLAGGDWHGAETIREKVRASPHSADIDLLGFVPQAELPDWYRAADVLVFPSQYEGFGLPPVEAMASGCPVLSTMSGALDETVGGAAGFLEPNDIGQMQEQLTRIAGDSQWRAELSSAGLSHARRVRLGRRVRPPSASTRRPSARSASADAPAAAAAAPPCLRRAAGGSGSPPPRGRWPQLQPFKSHARRARRSPLPAQP